MSARPCSRSIAGCSWTSSRTPTRSRQRSCSCWRPRDLRAAGASTVSRKAPLDWRSVALRPGALFVVGDPKQSIYRFRRADIEIYNLVRARIAESASGAVIPLTTNFRSTAALCDWANSVFKSQFPAATTPYSPQYAPLEPAPGERVATVRHEADSGRAKGDRRTVSGVCTLTIGEDVESGDVANRRGGAHRQVHSSRGRRWTPHATATSSSSLALVRR